jgi:hypothetical protein
VGWKHLSAQSLTDPALNTVNNFLPPDEDAEHNNNLIVSHNYLITNNLVNEVRFGLSFWQFQVKFPIQGTSAISTLGLVGLDPSDHPTAGAFPIFNFSDDSGNYSVIGRDKDDVTKSQTIQFADNFTWIKGRHTMKFGMDVRRVRYQDLESFGGADDFGAFTFDQGIFTGNAFANLLLGLPTKTYVAQSGPDVHDTTQTGLYAQDEFRINNRLTLTYGLRWQALPAFVSDLSNLTAFDIRNGGIIIPAGNQPRPGFLATINSCNPADPNNPPIPAVNPLHWTRLSAASPYWAPIRTCRALPSKTPTRPGLAPVCASSMARIFNRTWASPTVHSVTAKRLFAEASASSR